MEGPIPDPATLDEEGDDDIVRTQIIRLHEVYWLTTSVAPECGSRESQIRAFSIAAETIILQTAER